jgi:hypothetical protein
VVEAIRPTSDNGFRITDEYAITSLFTEVPRRVLFGFSWWQRG